MTINHSDFGIWRIGGGPGRPSGERAGAETIPLWCSSAGMSGTLSPKANWDVLQDQRVGFRLNWRPAPVTIKLSLIAIFLGILFGIPLGVWALVKQYTAVDSIIVSFSVLVESIPNFWFALMLIFRFSVKLHWAPTAYNGTISGWVLPIIVVTFGSVSMIIRSDPIQYAGDHPARLHPYRPGQGTGEFNITHSLCPAHSPDSHYQRIWAIPSASLLGGALIVETIFGMPGIGKYAVDSITARNYPSVLGGVVVLAVTFTLVAIRN